MKNAGQGFHNAVMDSAGYSNEGVPQTIGLSLEERESTDIRGRFEALEDLMRSMDIRLKVCFSIFMRNI